MLLFLIGCIFGLLVTPILFIIICVLGDYQLGIMANGFSLVLPKKPLFINLVKNPTKITFKRY